MSSSKLSEKKRAVIIGGGIGGTTIALCLHARNIPVTIYELRPEQTSHGGTVALSPNATRVLDSIGVLKPLLGLGYSASRLTYMNEKGSRLGEYYFGSKEIYGYNALVIRRENLILTLRNAVRDHGIPMLWEKKFKRLVEGDAGAAVEFEDGERVEAGVVIGADGMHSMVREYVVPGAAKPVYSGVTSITGYTKVENVTFPFDNYPIPAMLFGRNGGFGLIPTDPEGKLLFWFTTFELPEQSREEQEESSKDRGELLRMAKKKHEHWHKLVQNIVENCEFEMLSHWPVYDLPKLNRWSTDKGRVVLMGDAAHGFPPHGGQGAAMAIEDSATLALVISRSREFSGTSAPSTLSIPHDSPFAGPIALKDALKHWYRHRSKRVTHVWEYTRDNGKLRRGATWLQQIIREWIIWYYSWGNAKTRKWMFDYKAEDVLAPMAE